MYANLTISLLEIRQNRLQFVVISCEAPALMQIILVDAISYTTYRDIQGIDKLLKIGLSSMKKKITLLR